MENTKKLGLKKWEGGDRILHTEFNDNWDKIDTALGTRNCRFYTASYTGDGKGTKTWTFPSKPALVLIIGQSITVLMRDSSVGSTQMGSNTYQLMVTWEEKSVTATDGSRSPVKFANESNKSYSLFAILEAE